MTFHTIFCSGIIRSTISDAVFFSVNGQATTRRLSHTNGQATTKNSQGYLTVKPHDHVLLNANNGGKNQFEFNQRNEQQRFF